MTTGRAGDVQAEFSRQADSMNASARFTNEAGLARLREAVASTPEMRVLDLACGPGIVSEALASSAALVVGIDLTPAMLQRARARAAAGGLANVACVYGECAALPFASASFDVVVTRSAVHHFAEPATALSEAHRVLRPGGALVISDVVSSEDHQQSALHNAFETLRDPTHVRMLPRSEMLRLVTHAGFHVESSTATTAVRDFDEWLAITSAAERAAPLRVVMEELAEAGLDAGVNLRLEDGRLLFDHTTVILRARKPQASPGT